jgi:hypothetical protein
MFSNGALALLQFPVVCFSLLFLLAKIRLWSRYALWRYSVVVFFLYLVYAASAIVFLTEVLFDFGSIFLGANEQSVVPLVVIGLIFLVVPLFSHLILMLRDPRFDRKKKKEQLQQFFTTIDTVLVFLFSMPVISVQLILVGSGEIISRASVVTLVFFILTISFFTVYKVAMLPRLVNEKRLWWIILAEWLFLAGAYLTVLVL